MNQPPDFSSSFTLPSTKGCRRWGIGCTFLLLLLLAALCFGIMWLLSTRTAAAANSPLAVWLLIDNSNSMFEKDGIGSDPNLLRLDAARLFLSYLGVDEPEGEPHQAAVIFFGSTAETAVPLTPLTHDQQRHQLLSQIAAAPQRMGWTDHLAALEMAAEQIESQAGTSHPTIILLTDGEPEWAQSPTTAEKEAYQSQLTTLGQELADQGVSLFIILLTNEALAQNEDIANIWQPLWQQLAANTPSGQFFVAHDAAELPDIYHQVVVALTGRETDGMVIQTAVTEPTQQALTIPPNLSQLTLVISKENPAQAISILTGSGEPLVVDQNQVRRLGSEPDSREEIWVIEEPEPGQWQLQLRGPGTITIWQDTIANSLPTVTPTPTAAPTTTPQPTPTAVLTPTPTTSTTPTPTATTTAPLLPIIPTLPPTLEPSAKPHRWPWILTAVFTLNILLFLLYRRQRPKLHVTGALRLLDGHLTSVGSPLLELDTLQANAITIGQPPADIPLPQAQAQAVIQVIPGLDAGDDYFIKPLNGRITLNNLPLTHEARLTDTAVLDLDGVRLRYENLRLRQNERERQTKLALSDRQPTHIPHS
ncbi:MAG: VWA domain-containing protein [Ardenticatenaceae bacterium]|nr:VWA domain-containing protein [Ardenticatenaceae bacterium]